LVKEELVGLVTQNCKQRTTQTRATTETTTTTETTATTEITAAMRTKTMRKNERRNNGRDKKRYIHISAGTFLFLFKQKWGRFMFIV
jgi:hypothetical protein